MPDQVPCRQRGEPAQIEDPAVDAIAGKTGGGAEAEPQAVPERDDGQVVSIAVNPAGADRSMVARPRLGRGIRRQPSAVSAFIQVTLVVEGDRLEEDADASVLTRAGDAGAKQGRGVIRPGRARHDQARYVAQGGNGVVVVKVAAETLLIGQ